MGVLEASRGWGLDSRDTTFSLGWVGACGALDGAGQQSMGHCWERAVMDRPMDRRAKGEDTERAAGMGTAVPGLSGL